MRLQTQAGYFVTGAATLALLAGCSGGGSQSVTPAAPVTQQSIGSAVQSTLARPMDLSTSTLPVNLRRPVSHVASPGWISDDLLQNVTGAGAIFVSDAVNNTVNIYSTAGKQTGQLTGFTEPQGLATDTTANLYVADTVNSRVVVYAKPYKTAKLTLTDSGQYPAGVAVSGRGVVGVTNIISTASGPGSVSFYAKGATTPCATVSNATFARVYFDGFDDAGNLYIDGSNSSGSTVVGEVIGGCKAKTIKVLTTGNTITFPGGVRVSTTDGISIDDQSGAAIYTYGAPKNGSLGTPKSTTALTGAGDTVTFAFTSTNKDLWTADASNDASYEFAYPAGGSAIKTIAGASGGQPIGVALSPDEQP